MDGVADEACGGTDHTIEGDGEVGDAEDGCEDGEVGEPKVFAVFFGFVESVSGFIGLLVPS